LVTCPSKSEMLLRVGKYCERIALSLALNDTDRLRSPGRSRPDRHSQCRNR
jgi:hypothetical protein